MVRSIGPLNRAEMQRMRERISPFVLGGWMPLKKEKAIATLTIHGWPTMAEGRRWAIARWLDGVTAELNGLDPAKYSARVTFRWYANTRRK